LLEGLISLIMAVVQAVASILSIIFEFIVGFFIGATQTISFVDLIALLIVFLCELIFWFILWCVELIVSIYQLRKPKFIKKPVLWRPTLKDKKTKS